nr:PREDICTED: interleukin-8-like isoform X2 [Lepisosteus oculatus]
MNGKVLVVLSVLAYRAVFGNALELAIRCKCPNTISDFIPIGKIAHVKIHPEGPHCGAVEVIALLHTGHEVCLDPEARWVKRIIKSETGNN